MGSEKRKLPDMLGSQWNKEELSRFYKAYRKYGKNWRKVAGAIRSKSAGMVESLYNINKAFLSLPEGQGTADAFLAMMTDRHNILDISDNEQENNDVPKTIHKPKKRVCGKPRLDIVKGSGRSYHNDLQSHSKPSSHGCRPIIKFNHNGVVLGGTRRHPVGKRTPRIAVECFHDSNNKDAIISPNQEVSRIENVGSDLANTNYMDVGMYVNCSSQSLRNREAGGRGSPCDSRRVNSEGCGINEYKWNVKLQKERYTNTECEFDQNKDATEAYTGIVEEDELFSLGKLHTLADVALGLSIPTATELESSVHAMEQRRNLDTAHKSIEPRSTSMNHESDCSQRSDTFGQTLSTERNKLSKEMQQNCSLFSNIPRKKRKFSQAEVSHENGKTSCVGQLVPLPKLAHLDQSLECISLNSNPGSNNMDPTKPTSPVSVGQLVPLLKQAPLDQSGECISLNINLGNDVDPTIPVSPVCIGQLVPPPKRARVDESLECISLNTNPGSNSMNPSRPASPVSSSMPAKTRSRRKMTWQKQLKTSINVGYACSNKISSSVDNKADTIQKQLSSCLSSDKLRRWCMFEWFYSAIDYPWFATNEFVNFLKHIKLGNSARLSRTEWSIIRSSLGKPRRFSKTFLLEERKKLEQHRETVRTCYAESHSGVREGLSSDHARPLSAGQLVMTGNLKTAEIRDGSILTVYREGFGVQFTNSDIGTKFAMDVDCMPLNPCANFPVDLRNQNVIVNELCNKIIERNNLLASVEHPVTSMINHNEEALVTELRYMNEIFNEKNGKMIDGVEFKGHHAMLLSQLSEVTTQVDSGLSYLREHGNFRAPWLSSAELSAPDTFERLRTHDICQAVDIAERSRIQARTMVSASFQIGEREDSIAKIGEREDSAKTGEVLDPSNNPCTDPQISSSLKQQMVREPSENVDISSETKDLISDCLATCLMIQSCVDEEHAPTVIEETLKQALMKMQPSCLENQPIYQEIQRCMADIKIDLLKRLPSKVAV